MLIMNHLIGFGADTGRGPAQTAKSYTLNANNNNGSVTNQCRDVISSILAGGAQVRVTFVASTTGSYVCPHVSIGVRSSADDMSTNPPIELLFSGASGFSITAGNSITSDWADLTTVAGNDLLVHLDVTTENARNTTTGGDGIYRKNGSTGEYNTAVVSGYTLTNSRIDGISLVEVRT